MKNISVLLIYPLSQEKIHHYMNKLALRRRKEPSLPVCTKGETAQIEIMESISEMGRLLSPYGFVSCHRSYLCRIGSIYQIRKSDILLENGSVIPVSRRMYGEVNQTFIRHFRNISPADNGR